MKETDQTGGSRGKLSRRAFLALSGATGSAAIAGANMAEDTLSLGDVSELQSAVPIRNWKIGPIDDLPADEDGVEGDVYFATDGSDWHHDGDSWKELPVGTEAIILKDTGGTE